MGIEWMRMVIEWMAEGIDIQAFSHEQAFYYTDTPRPIVIYPATSRTIAQNMSFTSSSHSTSPLPNTNVSKNRALLKAGFKDIRKSTAKSANPFCNAIVINDLDER